MKSSLKFALCSLLFLNHINQSIFSQVINEIHYDNNGADSNEKIEIGFPDGFDITGWKIYLYNGGDSLTYDNILVSSGVKTDVTCTIGGTSTSGDFYVISYAGLQNGPRDGIALVNSTGSVISFISYEGTIQAKDGPANLLTSSDIGVSEDGTGSNTGSIQLTTAGWVTNGTSNTFGACNTTQVPLPIIYDDFRCHTSRQNVYISFSTASETNNDFFTIERSGDGSHFEPIGEIDGAGNSSEERQYEFTDHHPLSGKNYYRIKQTDFDGKFTYSEVKSVIHTNTAKVSVYPSITENLVNIQTDAEGYTVQVMDQSGRQVQHLRDLSGKQQIDLSTFASGMYYFKVVHNGGIETAKVLRY